MVKQVSIGEVFEFVRNGASIKQEDNKSGYPITRIETIWNETIDDSRFGYADIFDNELIKHEKYLLEIGDILMTHINSPKHLGKSAMYNGLPEKLIHGMNLLCLRPDKKISDSKYLKHYLNSSYFKELLPKISNQSVNQASFSAGNLKTLEIPLPPLPQQQKIANILDAADALRQNDKALIAKYDELTQALFLDMFGDPVSNPKGWEMVKLKDFINKLNTGVSVNSEDVSYENGHLFILKTSCVYSGIFDPKQVKTIRKDEIQRARLNPKKDSIIISRMNTPELVGKSAYIFNDFPSIYLPDRLWQTEKTDLAHSVLWLSYNVGHKSFMNEISKISSGTSGSMKNISKSAFLELKSINPPLDLQNQFAERVTLIEEQKAIAQKSLEKSESLFNSLLQKAFKGELA